MKNKGLVGLLVLGLLLGSPKIAAAFGSVTNLSAGSASGNPGQIRTIPVSLTFDPGVEISGLNFDLTFDHSRVSVDSVSLGPAATGMTLGFSEPSSGTVRVILFSLDSPPTLFSVGTTVNIVFNILPGAPPGTFPLAFSDTEMSTPGGSVAPHNTSGGSFTVNAPTSTPTPTSTHTPMPSNTSPPPATNTPDPSPTASSAPSATLTPSATATLTPSQSATTTRTPTSEVAGEGLDFEGAVAATGTALAEFERAVAATSTALAEIAARPADQIVTTGTSSDLRELCITLGLPLPAIVLARGVAYLNRRRQRT